MQPFFPLSRRNFLAAAPVFGLSLFEVRGAFAEELSKTPRQMEGPFYPDKLPLDTDNDLLIVNDNITPAVGEITHLTGKVLDITGAPIRGAVVEIWQCDAKGVYLHSDDSGGKKDKQDKNFQGFGRFMTSVKGEYYFRTIKPVPYPGRTPHIHVKVKKGGRELLCTQFYIAGQESNARDGIYMGAGGIIERELLTVDFKPIKESKIGELAANFTIVVGVTPEEAKQPKEKK
jgi:protocatechuate 3,4-dioxygenase, beta subunit